MPCMQCGRSFGWRNKEGTCESCKLIYCSKCLDCKVNLSPSSNKLSTVCFKCYDRVKNPNQPVSPPLAPPKILLNRMTAVGLSPHGSASRQNCTILPDVPRDTGESLDQLTSRLDKLRDVPNADEVPSQEELEERLRRLKDGETSRNATQTTLPKSTDKVSDLINQLSSKAKLDQAAGYHCDEDDNDDESSPVDEDELPWCCICNENARLRCTDCDGDLFCKACFKRTHKGRELKNHTPEAFKPTRNR